MESILNIFVVYFSYYCNSCYFCYKMKCLLFFLIFCYQMKFPGVLNTNLTLSFLYMHYSCHTSPSKYIGLIWTTQYWCINFNNCIILQKYLCSCIVRDTESFCTLTFTSSPKIWSKNKLSSLQKFYDI